ncbi:NAD(P)-binding protein [Pisolithus tinctorius]|nr:NAD(P)-binding protein [Pisolithus tinctorius]
MPSCTIRRSSFGGARSSSVVNDLVLCSGREGEVVAVGVDVERWKVGDCVCCNFVLEHVCGDLKQEIKASDLGGDTDGVLRKCINVPAYAPPGHAQSIIRIPDLLSYEEASTLPCAGLTPEGMKGGDYVLALRNLCIAAQIALASDASVIVTSTLDEKLEIGRELGVQHLISYKKTPSCDEEIIIKGSCFVDGGQGDHVIGVSGSNTLQKSSRSVKDSGYVHIWASYPGCVCECGDSGKYCPLNCYHRGVLVGSVMQFEDMNRLLAARNPHLVVESFLFLTDDRRVHLGSQNHVEEVVIRVSKD